MTKSALPRIAVTMGDPAGIGPETCLRLLNNPELAQVCVPVVFGDAGVLRRVSALLGIPLHAPIMQRAQWSQERANVAQPSVLDLGLLAAAGVVPGQVDARCGEAAFRSVIAAIESALAGQVDAVATAPLNKEAMHLAGHKYPGHTEIFAERMHAARSCMMLTSSELTCSFVTVHVRPVRPASSCHANNATTPAAGPRA